MADDYNDYRFENQSKTSRDFVLANGDVISVINAGRTVARPSARKRSPYLFSDGMTVARATGDKFIAPRTGSSASLSVSRSFNGTPAVSNDTRFLVQRVGAPANFTLNIGSSLNAGDIGTFSGMAVRGASANSSDAAGLNRESDRRPAFLPGTSNGVPVQAKSPAGAGVSDAESASAAAGVNNSGLDGIGIGSGSGNAAGAAKTGTTRGPKRSLVLSASDMENIKTYQLGGGSAVEGVSGDYAVSGSYSGSVTVNGGYHTAVEKNYYYVPGIVGGDGDVVIDDGGSEGDYHFGWIGIQPVRPGYGWIEPWRPGIIEVPVWPGEFEIVEDYGIQLTEGRVDFEGSDISKIELEYSAKVSFMVDATNAASFTIYRSVLGEDGSCSLTAIQTSNLVLNRETGYYEVTTKGLLLDAGEYCISIESTGPAPQDGSSYSVSINDEVTEYFTEGDNSDDWTDLKTAGENGEVADLGILDECSFDVLNDWVGYGDSVDYGGFTLDSAARLSFSIDADAAVKFTIYQLIKDKNGTYSLKALQTTTLSYDSEMEDYEAVTKGLLLQAGTYYISVQSTNADQGGSAYYNVYLDDENTDFFTGGDNSDDWTDLKTAGENGEVGNVGTLDECSFEVLSDWVGYGDSIDYAGFTLNSAAKLSFMIDATGAAKFTIYRLVQDKNGKYSLKALQTTSLSYDREFEDYEATTKALLLEAGQYYISVQSTNADQGGSAEYNVYLNDEDTEFFTEGYNGDDWTDLKTEGEFGEVGDIGLVFDGCFELAYDWVGCGDAVDYMHFTLDSAAKLSFMVDASDVVKFSLYQLVQDKNGTYSLKELQSTTLSYDREMEYYEAVTKALQLARGDYYICVKSTNADQGGSADYSVCINPEKSEFYPVDDSDSWGDRAELGPNGSVGDLGWIDEYSEELYSDWTGCDAADYAKISLFNGAKVSFALSADAAAKFTICRLVQDKYGKYSLETLQTTSLAWDKQSGTYGATTKGLLLEAGEYYVSMQATDASKGGASYTLSLNNEESVFFTEGDNCDDWTDLKTEGASGAVGYVGYLSEYCEELTSGWVGFGDAVDYAGFTLDSAGKVSFSLDATDAATFTIYRLVQAKNGAYSLTALQTSALKFDKASGLYVATTKGLLLDAGEYYFAVQSTNAPQGGGAYYNVNLNTPECTFYTDGYNGDDWTDLKTEGESGEVGYAGALDEYTSELVSDWVGFGDAADYMGFYLFNAAEVSFMLDATDAATFTVYQLVQAANGTYSLKALQTTALTWDKQAGKYVATTKGLLLEGGDYYFSMQSTNAAQGGSAYYNVNLNMPDCTFFTDGENWDDWTDLKESGDYGEVGDVGIVDEYTSELISGGWVGFGDAVDYMRFTTFNDAKLSFNLDATGAATFTVYELVQARNGTYSLKTLQTTSLAWDKSAGQYAATTKALELDAGEYYVSMQSTNAAQGGSAYYNLSLNTAASEFFETEDEYDISMPEPQGDEEGIWYCEYPVCKVLPYDPIPVDTVASTCEGSASGLADSGLTGTEKQQSAASGLLA